MIPQTLLSVLDNQLGIRAPVDAVLAIIATATTGAINTPQSFTRIPDVRMEHAEGPLVEAAAYAIERYGLAVLAIRAEASNAGAYGPLAVAFQGTSTPSLDASTHPADELDVIVRFLSPGTVGQAGQNITYQWSLDDGYSFSPTTSLGAATSITLPEGGRIKIDLGDGTVNAGDHLSFPTIAPKWSDQDLDAALDALRVTQSPWTYLLVYGDMVSTSLSTFDAKLEAMAAAGRPRRAMAHARKPSAGETEAQYLAALQAAFGSSSSRRVDLAAGYCKTDSSISRRRHRRPPALAVAPLAASVSEEIDLAELACGPLPGVFICDANGNPDEHDETIHPGLDDARFLTLRSWEGRAGVWVNNPRLFSPVGSDFLYLQYGRIIDLACVLVRKELDPILSRGVFVISDGSGRIEPETATAIEGQIDGVLGAELVGKRKATAVTFTLSRTDDVLRTGKLGWEVRVVPLAYIKKLAGTVALVAADRSSANVTTG